MSTELRKMRQSFCAIFSTAFLQVYEFEIHSLQCTLENNVINKEESKHVTFNKIIRSNPGGNNSLPSARD